MGAQGRVDLVVAEDVVEEVLEVLRERFAEHPSLEEALEWLPRLLALYELVPRSRYADEIHRIAPLVRDADDAPVLACAIEAKVELLVSGDKDLLVLREVRGVRLSRTRDVLRALTDAE